MLTREQRDELRRLLALATKGPWWSERRYSNGCEIVPRIKCAPDGNRECGWIADLIGAPYLGYESTLHNADAIAALRNHADAMLDDLDAKDAENERLRAAVADVLALTDTGTAEFKAVFGGCSFIAPEECAWVVSKIRERLLT